MKHNLKTFVLLLALFSFSGNLPAQLDKEERIIVQAMKDQLQYSMDSLRLNDFPRPWFIQYTYRKGECNNMRYSRGALFEEDLAKPISLIRADIVVKDKEGGTNLNLNQKGFTLVPGMGVGADVVPMRPDYDEIRRVFWWLSDVQYKNAVSDYEAKKSKANEPSLPETVRKTLALPDFYPLPKTGYYEPQAKSDFDEAHWRDLLSGVSGVYNQCKGLHDISASLTSNYSNIYVVNTEGSEMRHANSDMTLTVSIVAEGDNKTFFHENLFFSGLSKGDFPSKQEIVERTKEAADLVLAASKAELQDKEYFGPALVDAPVLVNFQLLVNLSASRTPVTGGFAAFGGGDNLGIRLFSPNISIKATPTLKKFDGQKLLGSYQVDADGVKPEDEIVLVESGIQKKFLGDRIPTFVTAQPTGNTLYMNNTQNIGRQVAPGVLQIVGSETGPADGLRRRLVELAKENGEKYAFVIRQLKNGTTNWFYKVDVESGAETLVRGCRVNLNVSKPLRRIVGVSDHPELFNLKYYGINNSIISPDNFLLEEISIVKM